jgi:hypothetical protein
MVKEVTTSGHEVSEVRRHMLWVSMILISKPGIDRFLRL